MIIYLKHFIHGTKVAISELEAQADEENGWVRYTLDTPSVEDDAAPAPVNMLDIRRRRRQPKYYQG